MIRRRVLVAGVLLLLFGLGWWAGKGGASGDLYSNLDLFVEVIHKVQDNYVDPVDATKLMSGALKGMLVDLDPFSEYLDRHDYPQLVSVASGQYAGVGLVVGVRDHWPIVVAPIEGGPAWQAGVRPGDAIVRIEGQGVAGLSLDEVSDRLRGAAGSAVRLSVRPEGADENQDYTITRSDIVTKSVPYDFMLRPTTGYLRLASFSATSAPEVRAAIARLASQGAKSLILDLRSNPGGILEQAVGVAEQFVPKGSLVVSQRGRAAGQDARSYATSGNPNLNWPIAVLVDGGSASASEIVAGALQDLDRALLVGATTYGKGSVQKVFPLAGGTEGLKLTTALYYTPSGRSIHRVARPLAEDEEDDADADTSAAASDSLARPRFRTAAGRIVFGGGGITPDVAVTPDSLPPLEFELERRALPFRFANRWANAHPNSKSPNPDAEAWGAFVTFARSEGVTLDDAPLRAERPRLEVALRRELARRIEGDAAAARIALEADPVARRALEALAAAHSPRELLAGVSAERTPAAGAHTH